MQRSLLVTLLGSAAFAVSVATTAVAQGGVTRFCTPGANGAVISATGSASLTANGGSGDLTLHASGLPVNTVGIFLQGNLAVPAVPFGQGHLCIGGVPQIWRLAVAATGPSGTSASHVLDHLAPPDPAAQITAGSTWNFQFWFRSGASSDLTDAIGIQFVPAASIGPGTELVSALKSSHPLGQTPSGGALVFGDAAAFAAFWSAHTSGTMPPPPPPPVDFSQDMAVAVFAGRRFTTGYSIRVRDLALSVTTLDVTSLEKQPAAGCGVFFAETNPMQIATVRRVPSPALGTWTALAQIYTCP